MAIERVKITPTLMRLKNSSGTTIFDSNNRYLKTVTNGSLNIANITLGALPTSWTDIEFVSGYPLFSHSFPYTEINSNDPTFTNNTILPAVAKPGYLKLIPHALNGGGSGTPGGALELGDIYWLYKNNTLVAKVKERKLSFSGYVDGVGTVQTGVSYYTYILDSAGSEVSSLTFTITPSDVFKVVHKWVRSNRLAAEHDYWTSTDTSSLVMFYYTGNYTLPLEVTQ